MNRAERRRRDKLARKARPGGGPDAALTAAASLHRAGRLAEAERAYRGLLAANPADGEALHLLGVLASQSGRHDEALALLDRAFVMLRPPAAHHRFNHGKALESAGRPANAVAHYRAAIALAPANADAHNNLGNALAASGDVEGALAAYRSALAAAPAHDDARRNLLERLLAARRLDEAATVAASAGGALGHAYRGRIARLAGDADEAAASFRRSLAADPSDPYGAALELAILGAAAPPPAAPAAYLRRVYGEKAAAWNATVEDPGYRGHALIEPLLAEAIADRSDLAILDLGCGTGALGPRLRPHARALDGVDLAPEMLARAAHRGVYDRLVEAEAMAFLTASRDAYDVIVAAAVLIHFAALAPIIGAAGRSLRRGGGLVCTLFKTTGNELETTSAGGFIAHAHAPADIGAACAEADLRVIRLEEGEHERRDGAAVVALALLAGRSD